MARNSTPESRAEARDKAEVIGQAELIVRGEIHDWSVRMLDSRAGAVVVALGFFGFLILAHWVVGLVNL